MVDFASRYVVELAVVDLRGVQRGLEVLLHCLPMLLGPIVDLFATQYDHFGVD